jgi:hypothetical protein
MGIKDLRSDLAIKGIAVFGSVAFVIENVRDVFIHDTDTITGLDVTDVRLSPKSTAIPGARIGDTLIDWAHADNKDEAR